MTKSGLAERKYSLPELLEEVREERESSALAQELVDQEEIGKLFKNKPKKRRGKDESSKS